MDVFFQLLQNSLAGSFAVLYLLMIRIVLGRLPKRVTYVLWLIVGFHFICTIAPVSKFAILPRTDFVDILIFANVNWNLIIIVYLIGLCAILFGNGINYFRLAKKLRKISVIADVTMEKDVSVYHCEGISSAFTFGFFNPQIYLPMGLDEDTKQMILLHENIHIQRRDYLIKLIAFLICAINWYNPLVWCAFYFFVRDQEASCDELVLNRIGAEHKKQYANAILKIASGFFVSGDPEHAMAFGEANVKYRIRRCVKLDCDKKSRYVIAFMLTAIFMIGGLFVSEKIEINLHHFFKNIPRTEEICMILDKDTQILYEINCDGIYKYIDGEKKQIYKEIFTSIGSFELVDGKLFFLAKNGNCIKTIDVKTDKAKTFFKCKKGKKINFFSIYNGIVKVNYTDGSLENVRRSNDKKALTEQEILANPGKIYDITRYDFNKAYAHIDLDNDGNAEEIHLNFSSEDIKNNEKTSYTLSVGESAIQGTANKISNEIYATSFDGKNISLLLNYMVILPQENNRFWTTTFVRYENKTLTPFGEIESNINYMKISGNTINAYVPRKIINNELVNMTWRVNSDGRIIEVEKDYLEVEPISYNLSKEITVHTRPEYEDTYTFTDQQVTIYHISKERRLKVGDKELAGNWVELTGKDGKMGWVFISEGILYESEEEVGKIFSCGTFISSKS